MSALSAHERRALLRQAAALSDREVDNKVLEAAAAMLRAYDPRSAPGIERARWDFWLAVKDERLAAGGGAAAP